MLGLLTFRVEEATWLSPKSLVCVLLSTMAWKGANHLTLSDSAAVGLCCTVPLPHRQDHDLPLRRSAAGVTIAGHRTARTNS